MADIHCRKSGKTATN